MEKRDAVIARDEGDICLWIGKVDDHPIVVYENVTHVECSCGKLVPEVWSYGHMDSCVFCFEKIESHLAVLSNDFAGGSELQGQCVEVWELVGNKWSQVFTLDAEEYRGENTGQWYASRSGM